MKKYENLTINQQIKVDEEEDYFFDDWADNTCKYKGNLKTVKKGFYGDKLTKKNISLEHLLPASQGGKTTLHNLVLASKHKNQLRGCDDLRKYATKKNIVEYLVQFMGIKTAQFNGDFYIANIIETLKTLGIAFVQKLEGKHCFQLYC